MFWGQESIKNYFRKAFTENIFYHFLQTSICVVSFRMLLLTCSSQDMYSVSEIGTTEIRDVDVMAIQMPSRDLHKAKAFCLSCVS